MAQAESELASFTGGATGGRVGLLRRGLVGRPELFGIGELARADVAGEAPRVLTAFRRDEPVLEHPTDRARSQQPGRATAQLRSRRVRVEAKVAVCRTIRMRAWCPEATVAVLLLRAS